MNTIPLSDGTLLKSTIQKINPTDKSILKFAAESFTEYTMQAGNVSLGKITDIVAKYASITSLATNGTELPFVAKLPELKPATVICCSDHGVSKMQVSAYPQETTLHMTANYLITRGGAANAFANLINSELLVVDMGINAETEDLPDLIYRKIAYGTNNSAEGPAMTPQQAITSLEVGIEIAESCIKKGCNVIIPGEMGISNTTSSAAIASVMCNLPPLQATGRGTNISDKRLETKRRIVQQILDVNKPIPTDGIDVLYKIGGFELGAIAGIILGAAANKAMVILDGLNTSAAALIAAAISPAVTDYLAASHLGAEPAHKFALKKLGLKSAMKMDFRLGEGLGSSLMFDLLSAGLKTYVSLEAEHLELNPENQTILPVASINMSEKSITLSDKTFNYYTNTMQGLNKETMEECQNRIDNLAKPIYSLGHIEKIAVELAGIIDDSLPPLDINKALVYISYENEQEDNTQPPASEVYSIFQLNNARFRIAEMAKNRSNDDYFEFGRTIGEKLSLSNCVIGAAINEMSACAETSGMDIAALIEKELLDSNGNLRYEPGEFLKHVPTLFQPHVSTLLGIMVAAAHNRSMIVLDDEITNIVARYAIALFPELQPFILPVSPTLYQLNITNSGGVLTSIGMRLIDASLHMLNDMKTFAEAQVAVANDGPGANKQI